jgi:hypothetical protein
MQQVQRVGKEEWLVLEHARKIAIIRFVKVGTKGFPFYRAVTFDDDPAKRVLLGYAPSLEHAATIVLVEYYKVFPPNSRRK